ncbi:MAG: DUF2628 domain-containing protein [Clostridia bacterium]|nr:DUF2628 domain-containing protein [Clostridia bacterium]
MYYENQICPGCGKPLSPADDVIVCPDCATPQHRACYEKLGSCVNGYLHASGYVWRPDTAENNADETAEAGEFEYNDEEGANELKICSMCGQNNEPDAQVCSRCGCPIPLKTSSGTPFPFDFRAPGAVSPYIFGTTILKSEPINNEAAGDIALYLKKGQYKFLPKFKRFAESGKSASWNWAAFFLSPFYFFYRRMLKVGFLFMGVFVAISLFFTAAVEKDIAPYYDYVASIAGNEQMTQDELQRFYSEHAEEITAVTMKSASNLAHDPIFIASICAFITAHIISGIFADSLIYRKIFRDMGIIRENCENELSFKTMLARIGGTSFMNLICSYFGYSLICNLLMKLAYNIIS